MVASTSTSCWPAKRSSVPIRDGDKGSLPSDDYGITITTDSTADCPNADFIMLNSDQEWDDLRSTAAHEMFHTFQDSFTMQDEDIGGWWAEATATWAEDFIYPMLDKEQIELQDGGWADNDGPLGPLDTYQDDGLAQYGAYIWPFYLTHRPGGDPTLIGKIYQQMAQQTTMQVLYTMPGWNSSFKQFALWDWNQAPVDVYRDSGRHIDALEQTPLMLGSKGIISLADATDSAKSQPQRVIYCLLRDPQRGRRGKQGQVRTPTSYRHQQP